MGIDRPSFLDPLFADTHARTFKHEYCRNVAEAIPIILTLINRFIASNHCTDRSDDSERTAFCLTTPIAIAERDGSDEFGCTVAFVGHE